MRILSRKCGLVFTLAASLLPVAVHAQTSAFATATLSNLHYQVIDLDATDAFAAKVVFDNSKLVDGSGKTIASPGVAYTSLQMTSPYPSPNDQYQMTPIGSASNAALSSKNDWASVSVVGGHSMSATARIDDALVSSVNSLGGVGARAGATAIDSFSTWYPSFNFTLSPQSMLVVTADVSLDSNYSLGLDNPSTPLNALLAQYRESGRGLYVGLSANGFLSLDQAGPAICCGTTPDTYEQMNQGASVWQESLTMVDGTIASYILSGQLGPNTKPIQVRITNTRNVPMTGELNYGVTATVEISPIGIPEPSTYLTFGLGLALMGAAVSRRRSNPRG